MRRLVFARWMAVALVPAVLLASLAASAQTEPAYSQEEETEPTPSEPKPPDPNASHGVARVSLVGGYRGLFDLSMLGGGVQLSYGSDGPVSGHANSVVGTSGTTAETSWTLPCSKWSACGFCRPRIRS